MWITSKGMAGVGLAAHARQEQTMVAATVRVTAIPNAAPGFAPSLSGSGAGLAAVQVWQLFFKTLLYAGIAID